MAGRVPGAEGLPEEAVGKAIDALYASRDSGGTMHDAGRAAAEATVAALPPEWLLAMCFTARELHLLRLGGPRYRADYPAWESIIAKLRSALALLEGGRE